MREEEGNRELRLGKILMSKKANWSWEWDNTEEGERNKRKGERGKVRGRKRRKGESDAKLRH